MLQHVVRIVTTAPSGANIMLPSATKIVNVIIYCLFETFRQYVCHPASIMLPPATEIGKCDNLFVRDVSAVRLPSSQYYAAVCYKNR